MPWAPLFTRRKQTIVIIVDMQQKQLLSIGVSMPIRFRFIPGTFLKQTGNLITPDGSESAVCEI